MINYETLIEQDTLQDLWAQLPVTEQESVCFCGNGTGGLAAAA